MTLEQEYYYNVYLKSPEWEKKRNYVFQKYKGRCVVDGCDNRGVHVHHLRYRHNSETGELDEDLDNDLILLCADHHKAYHFIETLREKSDPENRSPYHAPLEIFVNGFIEYASAKDVAFNREGLNFADLKVIDAHVDKFIESCRYSASIYEEIKKNVFWKSAVQNYFAALHRASVLEGKAAGASRKALEKRYGKSCVSKALKESDKDEQ